MARDIHRTLRRLQSEKDNRLDNLLFPELILSVAAPIVVERWLSFGVPSVIYWAAILACVSAGLIFVLAAMRELTNPYPVQSFLFDHFLARSAGTKEPPRREEQGLSATVGWVRPPPKV